MESLDKVKAVFFDFGGTIAFDEAPYTEGIARACRHAGHPFTKAMIDQAAAEAEAELPPMPTTIEGYRSWRLRLLQAEFNKLGLDAPQADALARQVVAELRLYTRPFPYPETIPVLSWLKENGYIVGIISNISPQLPIYLEMIGVASTVDFAISSGAFGAAKPDPRIFEEALRQGRVRAEEAVHVGDSVKADVHGAESIGIQPVLVDRQGVHTDPPCPVIANLADLLDMLGGDRRELVLPVS